MRKTWMVWLGCGVLALLQASGCKPASESSHADANARCPDDEHDEDGEGEHEGEGGSTIAEGSLGTGSPELCEQLANTYAAILVAHASCQTDADCGSYPEMGLCGATVNTRVPRAQLEDLHGLQIGYACPMPVAKCMPPAERSVCVANVCERG